MDNEGDEAEDLLIARRLTRTNDTLETVFRWGSLLVALSLLAYAGLYANL